MILLVFEAALAAPSVDVWATAPLARTHAVTYGTPGPSDATQTTYIDQDPTFAWEAGVGATLALPSRLDPENALVLDLLGELFTAEWAREPLPFRAAVWEVRAGLGWRATYPTGTPAVALQVEGGALLDTEIFLPTWFAGTYAARPGLYGRTAAVFGQAPVRPFLALRVGAVLGTNLQGTATGPTAFQYTYRPGKAFVAVEVGTSFHPRPPAPETTP